MTFAADRVEQIRVLLEQTRQRWIIMSCLLRC